MCSSPQLFAAYHVFLRLLVPRHPPCALSCLTFSLLRLAWRYSGLPSRTGTSSCSPERTFVFRLLSQTSQNLSASHGMSYIPRNAFFSGMSYILMNVFYSLASDVLYISFLQTLILKIFDSIFGFQGAKELQVVL